MNGGLDVPARQEVQSITGVDSQAPIKRFSPVPLSSLMILDLQCCNGLSE